MEEYAFQWEGQLTQEMQRSFDENGFFIGRNFMDDVEINQILKVLRGSDGILNHSFSRNDRGVSEVLYMQPGYDVTGMVARSEKIVDTCEKLLHSEIYHWCSMFIIKHIKHLENVGEHIWHQDYGYWYNEGCLYPDMIIAWVALDDSTRKSGCIQVLSGSHKLGRIDHNRVFCDQKGVDLKRIEQIQRKCGHHYLEMKPGDVLIHHCNLLHKSDGNVSDNIRRAFLSCYNTAYNSPVTKTHYPSYSKLDKVKNAAIKECTNYKDFSGKQFSKEV